MSEANKKLPRYKIADPSNYELPRGGGAWDLEQDSNGQWWCVMVEEPTKPGPTKAELKAQAAAQAAAQAQAQAEQEGS